MLSSHRSWCASWQIGFTGAYQWPIRFSRYGSQPPCTHAGATERPTRQTKLPGTRRLRNSPACRAQFRMPHPGRERKKSEVYRVKHFAAPNRSASLFRFRGPQFATRAENGSPPPALDHIKDRLFAYVFCAGEQTIAGRMKKAKRKKLPPVSSVNDRWRLNSWEEISQVP